MAAHLLCDLPHALLQVVVLLRQSSVLLEKRLADPGGQLQISLFLSVGRRRERGDGEQRVVSAEGTGEQEASHLLQQTCDGVDVVVGLGHLAHSVCT